MTRPFPEMQTNRLLLRQFTDADLQHVYEGLSHPDVIKHYGVHYDSLDATREQMRWFTELETSGTGTWWAICDAATNTFSGAAGLYFIKPEHRKAELGFWLLPQYWGKGIIVEALPLILHYGFTSLHLHRVEAFVESENNSSKKVMDKLQFRHEGTMQDCEIKNGRFISLDVYAKLIDA